MYSSAHGLHHLPTRLLLLPSRQCLPCCLPCLCVCIVAELGRPWCQSSPLMMQRRSGRCSSSTLQPPCCRCVEAAGHLLSILGWVAPDYEGMKVAAAGRLQPRSRGNCMLEPHSICFTIQGWGCEGPLQHFCRLSLCPHSRAHRCFDPAQPTVPFPPTPIQHRTQPSPCTLLPSSCCRCLCSWVAPWPSS